MKCVVCGCVREEHELLLGLLALAELMPTEPQTKNPDTDFLGDYLPEPPTWMDEAPPPEEEPESYDETVEPNPGERQESPGSLVEHGPTEPEDDILF